MTGPEWLRREAGRTVARGYAIEDREFERDSRGVAAPVFSQRGDAVAALAVVAPVSRLPGDRYSEVGEAVRCAADALTRDLRSDKQQ
jgi:IclR family acetate operon transcriptional repressor